jgi:hypothetical protein
MNRLALPLVLLLLSVFGVLAQAQTFTQSGQFNCDAASAHPIQYAYQFTCRGVPLLDSYVFAKTRLFGVAISLQTHYPALRIGWCGTN